MKGLYRELVSVTRDIKSMLPVELEDYFKTIGENPYRLKQVVSWLHKGVTSFSEMTNISYEFRNKLDKDFHITAPVLEKKYVSDIDGTAKYLWRLPDKEAIESVLMEYEHGLSVCLSTQVGCRMGCVFCASGMDGLIRNLTAAEILDQIIFTQTDIGKRISNIVLMGIGEPLDNFDNVLRFIKLVIDKNGLNIGARHITLSTCGVIENIDKLADFGIQLTLAVSLHAPDDTTRKRLMKSAHKYKVDDILASCNNYFKKTGRRITYEYAFIDGVNDSPRHGELLANKLGSSNCHLNFIYLNQIPDCDLKPSPKENVEKFISYIKQGGINYTIRRNLGSDITASCGLLRKQPGS